MRNISCKIWGMVLLMLCVVASCRHKEKAGDNKEAMSAEIRPTDIYVDTLCLKLQTFHRQMICNGKLRAIEKSDLSFADGSVVTVVLVHDGSRVTKGQLIAKTDMAEASLNVEKAQKELEKAKVQLADKLIGLGYDGISDKVPVGVMHRAKVSSGYFLAQYQLQSAKRALGKCNLVAPFSGRIADLDNRRNQRIDKLCTLINDSQLDVEFYVLEAEIKNLKIGQKVVVAPFVDASKQYVGKIIHVNPVVNDKGMIKMTARIGNVQGKLLDGMNVKIIIENDVPHSFMVPKDAVLERDGYQVVFMYKDGEAVWTYVDVTHSNISSYAITGCKRKETEIHVGDVVITSGNLNLADGTKVKIKKEKKNE